MRYILPALALCLGLSSCANQQQAQQQFPAPKFDASGQLVCADTDIACQRMVYRVKMHQLKVDQARKLYAINKEAYDKHPDAQHAAWLEQSKAALDAAVAEQSAGSY